jgi:uncharacterized protein
MASAPMRCELITWNRVYTLSRLLALNIRESGYTPDIIVAIGRGGYVPARILADYLDMMALTSMKIEHYARGADKQTEARVKYPLGENVTGMRVLVVDDVSDSGDTFQVALAHIRERFQPAAIKTAVLHHKIVSTYKPDFFAQRVVKWRWIIYPWAFVEDLSGFILRMLNRPTNLPDLAARLKADHNIRVPRPTLEAVLKRLDKK